MPKQEETAVATVRKTTFDNLKGELAEMAQKVVGLRKELKAERGVPGALMSAGAVTAGAAISGAVAGLVGDSNGQIAGLPVEVIVGIGAIGLGTGLGSPLVIEAGAGAISGWVQTQAFVAVKSFMKPAAAKLAA